MAQQMTKTGLMILHFFNCLGQSVFVDEAGSQLKTLMVLQAPGLLQVVQLWAVLSQLRRPGQSISNLPEIPYVESWPAWQLMLFVIFLRWRKLNILTAFINGLGADLTWEASNPLKHQR